jgi:hypothetical protein
MSGGQLPMPPLNCPWTKFAMTPWLASTDVLSMHACFACRVALRLFREAQYKDERMRERREHQEEEIDAAAHHARAQAMQDGTAQRSSGGGSRRSAGGSSGGCDGPSAAFYERQKALLERRKQREAQRRPSDEDELEECVCEWLQEGSCMLLWDCVFAGSRMVANWQPLCIFACTHEATEAKQQGAWSTLHV